MSHLLFHNLWFFHLTFIKRRKIFFAEFITELWIANFYEYETYISFREKRALQTGEVMWKYPRKKLIKFFYKVIFYQFWDFFGKKWACSEKYSELKQNTEDNRSQGSRKPMYSSIQYPISTTDHPIKSIFK
jgi:hypothetical protein